MAETIPSRNRWLWGCGAIILLSISIITIAAILTEFQFWSKPLAQPLDLPTPTPIGSELKPSNSPENSPSPENLGSTAEATQPEASEPTIEKKQPLCGAPETLIVLALGIDSRADNYLYGLADVIKIVRIDFVTPKVTVLSMPRDLWVEIPDISDHYGITHGKLNQAYFYGTPGMGYYDGVDGAPGLLARTLLDNFGLVSDNYATVNMVTFSRIVDALGGITIYLPYDVDGRPVDDQTDDMGFFEAGLQHFTGDEALRFSRIRKIDTVFDRMDRQTMVLCALKEKLLSPSVLPRIPAIVASFRDSVLTDLSPEEISQMACILPQLERENLIFTSLPKEMLTQSHIVVDQEKQSTAFVWAADYDLIREIISQFQEGTFPTKPDEPSCP